jgi:glycosyltransferase involved in cell wall biosynthesis
MIRLAARAARRVLTVSRASRDDIVTFLGVPPTRVVVTPLAGAGAGGTAPTARLDSQLLAVGNRMPHKGFETLLEALASIEPARRPTLVITGSHGEDPLAPVVARLGLGDHVDLRGWLSRDDLDRLYAESTALVFPTRFEGFGLPPLEAMARGLPVIVSDLPVMHEVAGDAAAYVDPADPDAIAGAIGVVLDSAEERERMSRAGLARAAAFSWERTAAATREALLEAAASRVTGR